MDVVAEAVGVIGEQLAVLAKAAEDLSHRELIGLLSELTTVLRSAPAVEHQVLARLLDETEPHHLGEASWKKVLTTSLRISSAEAGRRLQRAKNLGPRRAMTGEPLAPVWEATAAAQAQGRLGEEHMAVIAKFHRNLPSWVDVDTRAAADAELARHGSGLGPEELDAVAGRLLVMIDQDGPEPSETDRARRRGVTLGAQQRDGFRRISGYLDPETGAYLEAALATAAAPGANLPDGESKGGDTRTQAQRNHDGVKALLRRTVESGQLGSHNGLPVTVIVSTTLQELEKGAGVAVTGGGSLLPMPDLIRLAADAHHYLYVFDGHTGQSLYLGRAKRLVNAAQRIVLHARDRGCTRPGCTVPGYWCQAHHASADWKDDGHTDIDDLTLACGPDNRMIETTGWTTAKNTDNQTEWIPPPDLDTSQHRVNGYHHPERHLLAEEGGEREDDDDP
ncbi:HNH endonuclease signature motif containing protein [Mycolicibacterium gilvum]|uniref:Conserved protein of uncharacterized function possible rep13e12 repeat protein n=1 Tax=Mycolicibacterium gilvum TaxID=1804 RepID=A0A378SQG3_9MYCO|nr:HNH endonuclease signature motif containing protein [Mycolicibacterium gilvum]MCV7055673.1 HNH endonuclease [Mycolicibacterium gilvum]STZ44963.1 Conserved protein of uncharacterised function possible rep13e12 repeat protein [Mycolicibacterium gilvum]